MVRYDIEENSWGIYQHNPKTTKNTSVTRIQDAQSIIIERLDKAFVISGRRVDSNGVDPYVNGMLIYDFKKQTWEHKDTRWSTWIQGVVNHLAFDDSSSGYILGLAGDTREVREPWH